MNIDPSLKDLDSLFPAEFTEDQKAQAKTLFLKNLSLEAHRFYGGKMQTVPKCGLYGLNWFNVWYTPIFPGCQYLQEAYSYSRKSKETAIV
jgi:malate dehydrogenase (oxaloacetate-decarboxylating)